MFGSFLFVMLSRSTNGVQELKDLGGILELRSLDGWWMNVVAGGGERRLEAILAPRFLHRVPANNGALI
nr:hypothetical protein CFP56_19291 [Quercus suber]